MKNLKNGFKCKLVSKDFIMGKIDKWSDLLILDNTGNKGRKYFCFYMPNYEGSELIAELFVYSGRGNLFVDYVDGVRYFDNDGLMFSGGLEVEEVKSFLN